MSQYLLLLRLKVKELILAIYILRISMSKYQLRISQFS